jgi:membrane protein DedA with SNARE-associated domain
MIESLVNFLVATIGETGYLGIFFAMILETFISVIPSELILPFGGFLASLGKINLVGVIIAGGLGSYVGTTPFYFLGKYTSKAKVLRLVEKYGKYLFITVEEIEQVYVLFKKRGHFFVLFGRVVPLMRSLISLPAGSADMGFLEFSIYTIIGSTLWSALLATVGFYLGENWELIAGWMKIYETYILLFGVLCILAFVVYRIYSWKEYKAKQK